MKHQPHLGIDAIGTTELGVTGRRWYTHFNCPNAPKNKVERWNLITLDCYSAHGKLYCEACSRQFGKQVLKWLESHGASTFELNSLKDMQKFARKSSSKAYRAHMAFLPPK